MFYGLEAVEADRLLGFLVAWRLDWRGCCGHVLAVVMLLLDIGEVLELGREGLEVLDRRLEVLDRLLEVLDRLLEVLDGLLEVLDRRLEGSILLLLLWL